MSRICRICQIDKPMTEYYYTGRRQRSYKYSCKECDKAAAKLRRKNGIEMRRVAKSSRDVAVVRLRKEYKVSLKGIAAHVGVTIPTVKAILARTQIME